MQGVSEAREAVHRQQTIWLKVKAAMRMLAGHTRAVRQELASQKSLTAELELAAVQQQVQLENFLFGRLFKQNHTGNFDMTCMAAS